MNEGSNPHWFAYQPGFKFTNYPVGTPEFFDAVRKHRYSLEPHIEEIAQFETWANKDILDIGCGIATDGARFAEAGARYTGFDGSSTAIELAKHRFEIEGLSGRFELGHATELPFENASFDLVWSHGVLHHLDDTAGAIREIHRVLRPGGTAMVMLYHRTSFNYRFTILGVRRLFAALLLMPGADRALGRLTAEGEETYAGHRSLLRKHGLRYLRDRQLFLDNNTDGPGNELSKVYSRDEAAAMFAPFTSVMSEVRFLNLRIYPKGDRLAGTRLASWLGRRWGWHLYLIARA